MGKTKNELQQEALDAIGERSNVGVVIGTGGGKTLLGLKHMAKQYHDTVTYMIVAPKISIFKEWKIQAEQHGLSYLIPHMAFVTYRSLNKQLLYHDWIYLDECHSLTYSHEEWLNNYINANGKILGLTGTYPSYSGSEKGYMCETFCRKVFEYDIDEAIEEGMLNDYTIFIHMLKLNGLSNVIKKKKDGSIWKTSEIKDYFYYSKTIDTETNPKRKQMLIISRMKALQNYRTKVDYTKKILKLIPQKTLVFANTKDQADEICKHSYHSSNKLSEHNLDLFAENKIKELSCVDQLSEGKNIPNLKAGIIMHSYSNERKTRQKIGRFLRLNPDDKAIVHVLCYENSIDYKWVINALKYFDQSKIKIYRPT